MNPYFAQVNLKIGSLNITSTEDHLVEMTNVRVSEVINQTIIFVLYDDSALALEAEIINGENNIEFSYGYSGGQMSRTYKGVICKYNLEFTGSGATLTVEAVSETVIDATNPTASSYRGMTIDEIVAYLAAESGWAVGEIVKCKPVLEDDSLPATPDNYKVFNRENESAQEFIENKLLDYAISVDTGEGDFQFRLDESTGEKKVYFTPKNWAIEPVVTLTYVMGQEHEKIISFTPEFNDTLVALLGATEVVSESQNNLTNEYQRVSVTGTADSAVRANITRRVAGSSYSFSQMKTLSENIWNKATNMSYPATLIIKGDVSVVPLTTMEIVVMTKDGLIHHSSGKYLIETVEDLITGGLFTSTLKLTKNVDSSSLTYIEGGYGDGSNQGGAGSGFVYENKDGYASVPSAVPQSNVLNSCKKFLGVVYKNGGKTKQTGMDASGLIYSVMKDLGEVDFPQTAANQRGKGTSVVYTSDCRNLQIGDLIFWSTTPSYGFSDLAEKFLKIAEGELGYKEYANNKSKYGDWYGIVGEWCAMFVSWCANQAGISTDIIPKHAGCQNGVEWWKKKGRWKPAGTYTPKKGDIVYFDWLKDGVRDGLANHVGIVESATGPYNVKTIEGNTSGAKVARRDRTESILGFGTPDFPVTRSNVSQAVGHVAIYVGNGWVCQATSAYGSVHFAKLTRLDEEGIIAVRRVRAEGFGGVYEDTPDDSTGDSGGSDKVYVKTITVTEDGVNIRNGPGTGYEVLRVSSKGETLDITQTLNTGQYTWGKITTEGWIALKYTNYNMVIGRVEEEPESMPENSSWWDGIQYFKRTEFKCKCGGKYCNGYPDEMKQEVVLVADRARVHFGRTATVTSGLRCKQHNENSGGVAHSRHMSGKAIDMYIAGVTANQLLAYMQKQPEVRYAYKVTSSVVHFDIT